MKEPREDYEMPYAEVVDICVDHVFMTGGGGTTEGESMKEPGEFD